MLPATNQPIRLIALPLSRRTKSLIYFYAHHYQQRPSADLQSASPISITATPASPLPLPPNASPFSPAALVRRLTDAGAKQWNKLATSTHGSWKLKIYKTGERMMDKIPFEEWALKSIDPPSLSTKIRPAEGLRDKSETGSTKEAEEEVHAITLLYPGSLCVERELMSGLQRAMAEHEPFHRKWMKMNIFLSPLTLPCAIVPLIPNLPFFYMMWRSWSHWRGRQISIRHAFLTIGGEDVNETIAYKASRYLNQMIGSGRVRPIPSPILDSLYAGAGKKEATRTDGKPRNEQDTRPAGGEIILSQEMVLELQKQLDLPPESAVEISRGINQAQQRLDNIPTSNNTSEGSSSDSQHPSS
ncbi:hypothetical protein VP01_610g4 [Puccinia sorghi]|uniref:Mitochondrial K+-H+ exchange-related-domain-containing protein n=1 Tax=Puccinia sorghi TaxID=27349 RepID=A0A0L6UJ38_9BASI|nr:hypothetical protein VP01_610g4 [Puccinia sorghi]